MIRLGDAGVPVNWAWPLVTFILLTLALAFIWLAPGLRNNGAGRREGKDSTSSVAG
jgi:hypothetical protein